MSLNCGWCGNPSNCPLCENCRKLVGQLEGNEPVPLDLAGRNIVPKKAEPAPVRLAPPKPDPRSLPEQYAAFREMVDRIVHEEAPIAKVVTDFTPVSSRNPDGAFQVWLTIGNVMRSGSYRPTYTDRSSAVIQLCHSLQDELGARAVGAIK